MPRSDPKPAGPGRIDWRAWLALTWALVFAARYGAMIVEARGSRLLAALGRLISG